MGENQLGADDGRITSDNLAENIALPENQSAHIEEIVDKNNKRLLILRGGCDALELIHFLREKYGADTQVSRTTIWRALKKLDADPTSPMVINIDYHIKTQLFDPDPTWMQNNLEKIDNFATWGATVALRTMEGIRIPEARKWSKFGNDNIEDIVAEARMAILEKSGYPDRRSDTWLKLVARNAAYGAIKRYVYRHINNEVSLDSLVELEDSLASLEDSDSIETSN